MAMDDARTSVRTTDGGTSGPAATRRIGGTAAGRAARGLLVAAGVALAAAGVAPAQVATQALPPNVEQAAAEVEATAGRLDFWQGDFDAARARFEKAVALNPHNPRAQLWVGLVSLRLGEPGDALAAFRRALRAADCREQCDAIARAYRDLAGWLSRGEVSREVVKATFDGGRHYYLGALTAARQSLDDAERAGADYGDAQFWLALLALREERPRDALDRFERALGARLEPLVDRRAFKRQVEELRDALAAGRTGAGATSDAGLIDPARWLRLHRQQQLVALGGGLASGGDSATLVAVSAAVLGADGSTREGDVGVVATLLDLGGDFVTARREPPWELRLALRAGGDSNPAFLPAGAALLDPAGAVVALDDESDGVAELDARFEYHPFYDRGGWSLGLVGRGSQSLHQDLDALDATRLGAAVQLAWGEDPLGYLLGPLGYTRVPVGDRRLGVLLQAGYEATLFDGTTREERTELGLGLTVREGAAWATQLDLAAADLDVRDDGVGARARSGESWRVELGQYRYLGRRDRYVRVGVELGGRDAGAVFDAEHRELSLELALPLHPRWALQLAAAGRRVEFDEPASHPFFPSFLADRPREDEVLRLVAALIYRLDDRMRLIGRVEHVDSRVDLGAAAGLLDLDADRTRGTLGLAWLF